MTTEEVKTPVVEDTTKVEDKKVEDKQPEYTETQLKAIEQGWRPKEEFDGPEELFIDAAEFIRRGELFGKIENQRKEMAELRKTMRVMQDHHAKVKEAEFQRALDILRKQKVEALKEGEPEQVVEIETRIDEVKDALAQNKATAERERIGEATASPDPRFTEWVDKNRWYAQDVEMKEFADSVGIAYTKAHPGVNPVEVLKHVEKKIKVAYPEKFRNPNRDRASDVESGGGNRTTGNSKRSGEDYDMSEAEEKVFRSLNRSDPKFWTKERYVGDLKAKSYVRTDNE